MQHFFPLKSGIYIDEWKMARVIPIYKSENRSKCENYRQISILPIISKIFEREVFNQVYRCLNENSLISKFQSRFRPKYGTVSALIQMRDQWLTDMDNGKLYGVVFLDICKAFDSINHEILLRKLKDQFGIHSTELKWFESYLTNRKQVCSVNGQTSSSKKIVCGILQGSILGPLLFLLYINDMTDCLEKTTPYLYADDTEISSSSYNFDTLIENLNYDLNNIRKWLSKNKLKHHPPKSKVMFIGSSRNLNKKVRDNCVLLNNVLIPRAETFTCLGVDLDEKLSWEKHIEKICGKVSAGIGAMRRIKPFVPPVTPTCHTYKLFTKHWYSRILIIVRLCGIIAAKYSKINCKNFKIVQLGLSLEPATMLDLLMCSTPLGGRHSMQDDHEINRY